VLVPLLTQNYQLEPSSVLGYLNVKMFNTNSPLVSIIIITYNSSKYILETLESAKNQTYKNIELIISDDCSIDDTISICQNWKDQNEEFFTKISIIESKVNTGVAPNCNRGLKKAMGEWVKFIAGDDILLENCISSNIAFTNQFNDSFFFSKLQFTHENNSLKNHFELGYRRFNSNEDQLKILLNSNCLPAASSFIKRKSILALGGYDERYPMVEDYPLWVKVAKEKNNIRFLDVETVIYRIHSDTLSQSTKSKDEHHFFKNLKFWESMHRFGKEVLVKELVRNSRFLKAYSIYLDYLKFQTVKRFKNKKNYLSLSIFYSISLLQPSFYYRNFIKLKKF